MWTVYIILDNIISPWIVNDTANETQKGFLENANIKENAKF